MRQNSGNTLHIVYGNNHFELVGTCYQITVYFNYQNQFNMYETNNDGMTKEPTNEFHNKQKEITWTF
jgi:hypothetical protein